MEEPFSIFKEFWFFLNATINYFQEKLETENSQSLWESLTDLGMSSKKGKASSDNIGLKIDGELSFDN